MGVCVCVNLSLTQFLFVRMTLSLFLCVWVCLYVSLSVCVFNTFYVCVSLLSFCLFVYVEHERTIVFKDLLETGLKIARSCFSRRSWASFSSGLLSLEYRPESGLSSAIAGG